MKLVVFFALCLFGCISCSTFPNKISLIDYQQTNSSNSRSQCCNNNTCCSQDYACVLDNWCVYNQSNWFDAELMLVGIIVGVVDAETGDNLNLTCVTQEVENMLQCITNLASIISNYSSTNFGQDADTVVSSFACVASNMSQALLTCNKQPWWQQVLEEIVDITEDAVLDLSIVGEGIKLLVGGIDIGEDVIAAYDDYNQQNYPACGEQIGSIVVTLMGLIEKKKWISVDFAVLWN